MEDGIPHVFSIQYLAALFIDDLSLLIHNLVVFQKILTDTKVIALNFLLSLLYSARQHLMFNLLALFYAQCIEYIHQTLGTKQTHQIIFQGNVKSGLSRVALTSGTSPQLVINPPGFMTLCTNDLQSSGSPCFIIQLNIRSTSGHVGGDGHSIMHTRLSHDLCLQLVIFRI